MSVIKRINKRKFGKQKELWIVARLSNFEIYGTWNSLFSFLVFLFFFAYHATPYMKKFVSKKRHEKQVSRNYQLSKRIQFTYFSSFVFTNCVANNFFLTNVISMYRTEFPDFLFSKKFVKKKSHEIDFQLSEKQMRRNLQLSKRMKNFYEIGVHFWIISTVIHVIVICFKRIVFPITFF